MFAVVTWTLDEDQFPVPTVHGPFPTEAEAKEWGTDNDENERHDWHVVPVQPEAEKPKKGVRCLCSKCDRIFLLSENGGKDAVSISIDSCQSGGVYGASVYCPYCSHEHYLM